MRKAQLLNELSTVLYVLASIFIIGYYLLFIENEQAAENGLILIALIIFLIMMASFFKYVSFKEKLKKISYNNGSNTLKSKQTDV